MASPEEVHALSVKQSAERKRGDKIRQKRLGELGFEIENSGDVIF
jgi:hypothetical protein